MENGAIQKVILKSVCFEVDVKVVSDVKSNIHFFLSLFILFGLTLACSSSNSVEKPLEKKEQPDLDDFGRSTLSQAIITNNEKAFYDALLLYPKWKNYPDKFGMTPIHYAASTGNEKFFQLLVRDGGVHLSVKDNSNETVIHKFARVNMMAPIAFLKTKGLSLDETNKNGLTPLHIAASAWNVNQVQRLIENDVNINIENAQHETALHLAISTFPGVDTLAKVRLNKELTVAPVDTIKKSAWILTRDRFKLWGKKTKQFFVNFPDLWKSKPVLLRRESEGLKTVELLLNEKPNLKIRDTNGLTALEVAKQKKHLELLKLLVKRGLIKTSEL